jgi:hypothetical protein
MNVIQCEQAARQTPGWSSGERPGIRQRRESREFLRQHIGGATNWGGLTDRPDISVKPVDLACPPCRKHTSRAEGVQSDPCELRQQWRRLYWSIALSIALSCLAVPNAYDRSQNLGQASAEALLPAAESCL